MRVLLPLFYPCRARTVSNFSGRICDLHSVEVCVLGLLLPDDGSVVLSLGSLKCSQENAGLLLSTSVGIFSTGFNPLQKPYFCARLQEKLWRPASKRWQSWRRPERWPL